MIIISYDIRSNLFTSGETLQLYRQNVEEQFWSIYYFSERIDVDVGPGGVNNFTFFSLQRILLTGFQPKIRNIPDFIG